MVRYLFILKKNKSLCLFSYKKAVQPFLLLPAFTPPSTSCNHHSVLYTYELIFFLGFFWGEVSV